MRYLEVDIAGLKVLEGTIEIAEVGIDVLQHFVRESTGSIGIAADSWHYVRLW
jgi:hypothetical protein